MSIRIQSHTMTSNQTIHAAARIADDATPFVEAEHWRVSWLPGRVLTRNEAITAMTLAEAVAVEGPSSGTRPHIENWAGELGLIGQQAVHRVFKHEMLVFERLRRELATAGVILRRIQAGAVPA